MTLTQALCEFSLWGQSRYSPRTVHTYTGLIRRFTKYVNNKHLKNIKVQDITDYYIHLKQAGYAESSIAFMMISLRQFFRYFFLQKKIDWDYQLIGIPKYTSKSYEPVTSDETVLLLDNIKGEGFKCLRDKTMVAFLFASGVRVSELCDLNIKDLNLKKKYANIISKKNKKKRTIFWDERTNKLLEMYILQRNVYAKNDSLFISLTGKNRGKRLSTRSVQRIIEKYRPADHISPHSFRHGLGMRAVQSGVHPRYIQIILGHLNLNSQQVYLDVYDGEVADAYQKIVKGA